MIIVALDQSSTGCGVAVVDTEKTHLNAMGLEIKGGLLESATLKPKGKFDIERIYNLGSLVKQILEKYSASLMVVESHIYGTLKSSEAAEGLASSTFICRFVAWQQGLQDPIRLVVPRWKKIVTGSGKAKKPEVKQATCTWWGKNPSEVKDDNQSDALAIAQAYLMEHVK